MRLAVFDTTHYEMLNVWAKTLISDYEITIFTTHQIKEKFINTNAVFAQKLNFFELRNDDVDNLFFHEIPAFINDLKPEYLLFNTIDQNYRRIYLLIKNSNVPVIVTVHNINTWLFPPFTLNKIALYNYYYRSKIVKLTAALVVQEESFIEYIRNKKAYKKHIFAVPHTIKELKTVKDLNNKITIAIPGAIDGVRRDNDLVLNAIEKVFKYSNDYRFIFLGNILGHLGEQIASRIKLLSEKGFDVDHHYDSLSNDRFDQLMIQSDIILLPLNIETRFEGIKEIYGISKVSGVLYDMMRFARPGIVPESLVIPSVIKGSLLKFKNEDHLVELILSLNRENISDLTTIAENESDYYSINNVRERILIGLESIRK